MAAGGTMSEPSRTEAQTQTYIQALALGLDPAWRRLPDAERATDARDFCVALEAEEAAGVRSFSYSSIGLERGVDVLLWRMAPSVDVLGSAAARLLTSGLGRSLQVQHSLLGRIG